MVNKIKHFKLIEIVFNSIDHKLDTQSTNSCGQNKNIHTKSTDHLFIITHRRIKIQKSYYFWHLSKKTIKVGHY